MALLDDGFSTKITFGTSTITLYEETEVTPPALSGGGKKEVTTMHNTKYRTAKPKKLVDVGDIAKTVRYDPAIYSQIIASIQVNQLITIEFPDGSELAIWGWLEEFTPGANVEGEPPTAEVLICASNLNGTNVETAPAFTAAV